MRCLQSSRHGHKSLSTSFIYNVHSESERLRSCDYAYLQPFRISVCKAWSESVARVLTDKHLLDFRRLLACSHQRHFVSHWIHRSSEDRFRVNAELVPEIRLLDVEQPPQ